MKRLQSATGQLAHTLAMMSMVAWSLLPNGMALANPQGGDVVEGRAKISQDGVETVIRQRSDDAIINWQSFNIGVDETVRFLQPDQTSRILNRVMDGRMTQIDGRLFANGQVYIANPNGIFFGGQAVVNTAHLVAAAGNITNRDFMRGNDRFTGLTGDVVNYGSIESDATYLIGQHVKNYGSITATDGLVMMLAGDEVYLSDNKSPVLIKVSPDDGEPGVLNAGTVDVGKGKALFSAADAYSLAVRNEGTVRGRDIEIVAPGSRVQVAGLLDASDEAWAHERNVGGSIQVLADEVVVADGATLDASGGDGGGQIRVGGDVQGRGDLHTALYTYVGDAVLDVNATFDGDAGSIVVWAEHSTWFYGTASATGGAEGGDGGFVEVSGLMGLDAQGQYDLSATSGLSGTLLFDPIDIVIVGSASEGAAAASAGTLQMIDEHGNPLSISLASLPSLEGFRITESRLESGEFGGGGAQVVLDARRSITVAGEFTDSSLTFTGATIQHTPASPDSDHLDIVPVTQTGATLLLTTHNSSEDGAGVIDLAGSGDQPLQLILANGANLKILASASGQATGDIRLGHVTTDGGRVEAVTGRGSIDALGHINAATGYASLHASDDLNVHGGVTASAAVLHAGSDSSGQLNLDPVAIHADTVHLWAGDAGRAYYHALKTGGEYTPAAHIGDLSNVRFTSRDGAAAPRQFLYRQDADVHTDALPEVSQFGNGDSSDGDDSIDGMYYLLQSGAGSVELHNTRKIMHTSLDIWGETGVWIGNSMKVDNLYVGTNGSIMVGRDAGAEIIVVTDDDDTHGEVVSVDSEGDLTLAANVVLTQDSWFLAQNVTFGGYVTSGIHPAFLAFDNSVDDPVFPVDPNPRPLNSDANLDFTPYFGPFHLNIWARGGAIPINANEVGLEHDFAVFQDGIIQFFRPIAGEVSFNGAIGNLYGNNGALIADPNNNAFLIPNLGIPPPQFFYPTRGNPSFVPWLAARAIQESGAGILTLTVRANAAVDVVTGETLLNSADGSVYEPGLIVFNFNPELVNLNATTVTSPGTDAIDFPINVNVGGNFLAAGTLSERARPGVRTVGAQIFGHPADDPNGHNVVVIRDETWFLPQGAPLRGIVDTNGNGLTDEINTIPGGGSATISPPGPYGAALPIVPGSQLDGTWGDSLIFTGELIGERPATPDQPFAPPATGRVTNSLDSLTFVLNFDNGTAFTPDINDPIPPSAPASDVTGTWTVGDMDIESFINIAGLAVGQRDALIAAIVAVVREMYEQIPTSGQDPRSPIPDGDILDISFQELNDFLTTYDPDGDLGIVNVPEHYFVNIGSNIGLFSVPGLLGIASEVGAVRNQHPEDPNVIDNIGPNVWYEQLPNGTIVSHPVQPGSVVATVFTDQAELFTFPLGQAGFVAAARFTGNIIAHEVAHTLGARHTDAATSVTPHGFPDIMATPATETIFDRMEFSYTGTGNDAAFPGPPATPVYVSTVGTEITNIDILFGALGSQPYPDGQTFVVDGGTINVDIADATVIAPGDVTFFGNISLNQINLDNASSSGAVASGTGTLIIGGDMLLKTNVAGDSLTGFGYFGGFYEGRTNPFAVFRLNGNVTEAVNFTHNADLFVGVESVVRVFDLIVGLEIGIDVFGDPLPTTIVEAQDVSASALNFFDVDGLLVLTNRDRNGIPFVDRPDGFTLTIKADQIPLLEAADDFSNDGLPGTLVLLPRVLNDPPLGSPIETEDANIGINSGAFAFNVDPDFFSGVTGTTAAHPFNLIIGTPMDPFTGAQSTGDVTIAASGAITGGSGVINMTLYGEDVTFSNTLTLTDSSSVNFHLTGGVTASGGTDLAMTTGIGTFNLFAAGNVSMVTDISQLSVANTGPGSSIQNFGGLALVSVSSTGDLFVGTSDPDADLVDSGPVVVGGNAFFTTSGAGADIDLDQLSVTGLLGIVTSDGNAVLTNTLPINFDFSLVNGDLTATSTTGGITQSAAMLVNDPGAVAEFNAAAGSDIILNNPGNDFDTVAFTGRDVTVSDLNALTFGAASSISSDLTATTAGGNMVFDAGSVGVGGLALLNSSSAIDFGSGLTFGSLDATAVADITMDAMNVTGLAMLDSGATIDFLDTLTAGSLDATAVNDLMLSPGSLMIGGDAALRSTTGAIDTADNANGDSELTAGGEVTLQGVGVGVTNAVEVAGIGGSQMLTLINTGGAGDNINVDVLGAMFTSLNLTHADVGSDALVNFTATADVIGVTGGAVAMLDGIDLSSSTLALGFELIQLGGEINLGSLNMAANSLSVTSNDGNITNSDSVLSTGVVTLDSGAADTMLDNAGNDFNVVNATGNIFELTDINSLTLNTDVNQVGVNLNNVGGVGVATVIETNGVTIANSTISGNTLNFTAAGDLTVADTGIDDLGLGGTVGLASMTNIDGTDNATADIIAANLTLNAPDVGVGDTLDVTVTDNFTANVGGTLNVDSIGDLPIGMVQATSSEINIDATGFGISGVNPDDFFPDIRSSHVMLTADNIGPLELFVTSAFTSDVSSGGPGASSVRFIDGRPGALNFIGGGTSELAVVTNPVEDLPGEPADADTVTSRFYVVHPDGDGAEVDWMSDLEPEGGVTSANMPRPQQYGAQRFSPRTLGRLLVVTGRTTVDFNVIHQTVFNRFVTARQYPSLLGNVPFSADDYIAYLRRTATIGRPGEALDAAIVLDGLREFARNLDLQGLYAPGYQMARLNSLAPHAPVGMSAADLDAAIRVLVMLDQQTVALAK